jgi:hypothetical protein
MRGLIVLLFAAGVAHATVHPSRAGKVTVDVPANWKLTETDENTKWVSANNQVALVLWVLDTTDFAKVIQRLGDELVFAVDDPVWGKPRAGTVNGLAVSYVDGRGTFQARPDAPKIALDVRVMIAATAAKKGAVLVAIVAHDKSAANKRTLDGIFASVKPL